MYQDNRYIPEDPSLIAKYHSSNESKAVAPTILAMGVGGGGCNAVSYMANQGIKGVDFVALNTDNQALLSYPVNTKVLLGPNLSKGLGAGGDPDIGRAAAEESVPEIRKILTPDVKMVFVTAGMGGGTGTGGAPVVARVAKEAGILTVGIVTIPFFFEGQNKINMAMTGAAALKKNVDALLLINNDRLSDIYPDMRWDMAFTKADDILTTAAQTISDMVTTLANINIDMRDVDTCLRNGQTAIISVGYGEGEGRMSQAIQNALHSPLLCDTDIMTSKELLFAFYYSPDIEPPFLVSEAAQANTLVQEINKRVHIKFGWGFDPSLENKIKFTILASGFDMSVKIGDEKRKVGDEPATDNEEAHSNERLAEAYGREKVEDFIRRQETQNFYILAPDQLDSDEAIEMLEQTPAYRRDKRKDYAVHPRTERDDERDTFGQYTAKPANKTQDNRPGDDSGIIFSMDDRF